MLNWSLYFEFLLVVVALLVVPGPTMALVVLNTFRQGCKAGIWTSLGVAIGETTLVIGAIGVLSTFPNDLVEYTDWLRWIATGYILYLAILAWRSAPEPQDGYECSRARPFSSFLQGLAIAVCNPKMILFYTALFPGFVDTSLSITPQLIIIGTSLVLFALVFDLICILVVVLASIRNLSRLWRLPTNRFSAIGLAGVAVLISPLNASLGV